MSWSGSKYIIISGTTECQDIRVKNIFVSDY